MSLLLNYSDENLDKEYQVFADPISEIFAILIFAPFIETILFQFTVIYVSLKVDFLKNAHSLVLMMSALLFGLGHYYPKNHFVMIHAFIIGLVFAYLYLKILKKEDHFSATIVTILTHFFVNLYAYIFNTVIDKFYS